MAEVLPEDDIVVLVPDAENEGITPSITLPFASFKVSVPIKELLSLAIVLLGLTAKVDVLGLGGPGVKTTTATTLLPLPKFAVMVSLCATVELSVE